MTEWWVSQAKHWCEICKVWHGGHIQQIMKHRSGRMHQEREEAMLKGSREREKERQKDEQAVERELREIERAAERAMIASGEFVASGPAPGSALQALQDPAVGAQKRAIEATVEDAKRRRAESSTGALQVVLKGASPAQVVEAVNKAANSKLIPWMAQVDPGSGHPYYFNTATQESSWTVPPELLEDTAALLAPKVATPSATPPTPVAASAAPAVAAVAPPAAASPSAAAAPPAAEPWQLPPRVPRGGGRPSGPPSAAPQANAPNRMPWWCKSSQESEPPSLPSAVPSPAPNPVSNPAPSPAPNSSEAWVVVTDPGSGRVYYHNNATGISTWERPADLAVDVSRPPPPPTGRKPPPPPPRKKKEASVGGWEEVAPEDSMWGQARPAGGAADDSDEEASNPVVDMKNELMEARFQGQWVPEDFQVHEKEAFEKKSTSGGGSDAQVSFPLARKRAAGIRRRGGGGGDD